MMNDSRYLLSIGRSPGKKTRLGNVLATDKPNIENTIYAITPHSAVIVLATGL